MSSFTVRIQIPGSHAEASYIQLHNLMLESGFSRQITSNDGLTYQLPNAEYNISGNFTRGQILNLAFDAAKTISMSAEILVTESAGRTWKNLKSVDL